MRAFEYAPVLKPVVVFVLSLKAKLLSQNRDSEPPRAKMAKYAFEKLNQ